MYEANQLNYELLCIFMDNTNVKCDSDPAAEMQAYSVKVKK